jgi:hypothetical protein
MRMTYCGDKDGSFEIFVQIGPADPAPRDVDGNGPGTEWRFWNVLDPNISGAVITS